MLPACKSLDSLLGNAKNITEETIPALSEYISCESDYEDDKACFEEKNLNLEYRKKFKNTCETMTTNSTLKQKSIFSETSCNQDKYPSGCQNVQLEYNINPISLYLNSKIPNEELTQICNKMQGNKINIQNELYPTTKNISLNQSVTNFLSTVYKELSYEITLQQNKLYSFSLISPNQADYDIILSDENGILISNLTQDSKKNILYSPTQNKKYKIVIKRISGSGYFTLLTKEVNITNEIQLNVEKQDTFTDTNLEKWFHVNVTDGEIYKIYLISSNTLDANIYLYNSSNELIAYSTELENLIDGFSFQATATNKYKIYVQSRNNTIGNYTLACVDETLTVANSKKNAVVKMFDFDNNTIQYQAWYQISLQNNQDYAFNLKVPSDSINSQTEFRLCIYRNRNNNQVKCSQYKKSQNIEISYTATSTSNYWVLVESSSYSGNSTYTLTANQILPVSLSIGSELNNQDIGDNSNLWYSINLTANNFYKISLIANHNQTTFTMTLYKDNKNQPICSECINSTVAETKNARIYYKPNSTGLYFLKIESNSIINNQFNIKASLITESSLTLGNTSTSFTFSSNEIEKWHTVTLTDTTNPLYIINLTSNTNDSSFWISVVSIGTDGSLISYGDAYDNILGVNLKWIKRLTNNNYKIKVERLSGTNNTYSLDMNKYTQPAGSLISVGTSNNTSFTAKDAKYTEQISHLSLTQSTLYTIDVIKDISKNGEILVSALANKNAAYSTITCPIDKSIIEPNCALPVARAIDNISIFYSPSVTTDHKIIISKIKNESSYNLIVNTVTKDDLNINTNVSDGFTNSIINKWYSIDLTNANTYNINLTTPSNADYDLYLYNPSNILILSSTQDGIGINENILYTPTIKGTNKYTIRVVALKGLSNYTLRVSN